MHRASYIDSYYRRTMESSEERASLYGARTADACIVGGGLAGITAALELARRGRSVILLEAQRVGWGASGRNGGFVGPGYSAGLDQIQRRAGIDGAKALYRLSMEGVEMVADNIRRLAIGQARVAHGILRALRYDDPGSLKAVQERMARDFDRILEFKSREEVRQLLHSAKYHQALFDPHSFHFHPLNYARALVAEIERLGGAVFEESAVIATDLAAPTKVLRTADGTVTARNIVFACGGYLGRLMPLLARSHLPIATYVFITERAADRIADAIRTRAAVSDDRRANDYYRIVDDGARILWGGKITTRTSEPRRLGEMLRQSMVSTYPQLAGVNVELAWSGLMSYARHLMPLIGQIAPGFWYCTGFGGHGMNTTAIGGRVIAEAIAGETDRYRLFAPFGLAWSGGPLGRAAAQLTYWRYQAMDFIRERKAA